MPYLLTLWLLGSCTFLLQAQVPPTGLVQDAQSGDALPFVNIIVNGDPHLGTITDMDGYFELPESDAAPQYLDLSYVGYKAQRYYLDSLSLPIVMTLQKVPTKLHEVVVVAGENPAYRLIRLAQANRQKHNPERIPTYTCDVYHKMRVYSQHNAPEKAQRVHNDSSIYYTLLETISSIRYKSFDLIREDIHAVRWSGFKRPEFVTIMGEIQPFGFHRPNIIILDREYFNPIAKGSIAHYEFRLEDTLYQNLDTVYTLRFFPRKHCTIDALEGVLQINTNGYALQSVRARPAAYQQNQKVEMTIEQQYAYKDGQYWFPTQHNFELQFAPHRKDTFIMQGKKYFSNVVFDTTLQQRDFGWNKVNLSDLAHDRDSTYWNKYRHPRLTLKEKRTYEVIDQIAAKTPLNSIANSINEWEDQRLQLGLVSINMTQLVESNLHEKFRLGFNLYTSYLWSPYVTVGGYGAYGFGDKKWKHGASLTIRPRPRQEIGIQISYMDDLLEPAAIVQNHHSLSKKILPLQNFLRRNMLRQMDWVQELEISAFARLSRHLIGRIFANWSHLRPMYAYAYQRRLDQAPWNDFTFARFGAQLRFAYREALVQFGQTNLSLQNRYPIVYLSYTRSLEGFLSGQFDYHKLLFGVEYNFFTKGLGRTRGLLQAGWIGGEAPYSMLFNGRGSYAKGRSFVVRNTFQTMRPNEFVNRHFVYAFLQHDFGTLLFRTRLFQPKLRIHQAVGFGWLPDADHHLHLPVSDISQGYYESGLVVADIIRIPIFNYGFIGFGGGAFMRYGPYSLGNKVLDNMVFKLDMSVSL